MLKPLIFCHHGQHSIRCDLNSAVLKLTVWVLLKTGAFGDDEAATLQAMNCMRRL
jgi:hypothetical protein